MHALIVGSAPANDECGFYTSLLASSELVIGADGGAVFATGLGRVPDIAVGDFDSSSAAEVDALRKAGARIVVHPTAKDETDLDLALHVARAEGARRVTLTAAFSDRLDHTLAALGTLMRAADLMGEVREPSFTAWIVGGVRTSLELVGEEGSLVSLLAPAGASGVTTHGLGFPLQDAWLEPLSSLGVSNLMTSGDMEIVVKHGVVIVIAEGGHRPPRVGLRDQSRD